VAFGAGRDPDTRLQPGQSGVWLRRADAVALDEIFPLIGHAVLHGDAAGECGDGGDRPLRNRLGMIEEPVEAVDRDVLVDPLEGVERRARSSRS